MSEQQSCEPAAPEPAAHEPAPPEPAAPEPAPPDAVPPCESAGLLGSAGPSQTVRMFDTTTTPLPTFDAAGLLARQMAAMDEPLELSAAEIAALPLSSDEPPDLEDVPWWLSDEFFGSDEAEQAAWLRGLPPDIAAAWRDEPRSDDLPGAGFTHHDQAPGPRPDAGFAAGGVLDGALPGPVLAAAVDAAADRGDGLGESELIGVLCAWQRLASWAQAGQAASLNVLVARRKDQSVELRRPALAGHVDDEVAAALSLTGQSTTRLLSVSAGLARLPGVLAALRAGRVDWAKAMLFTDLLAGLPDGDAHDIAEVVLSNADGRTTGQLRAALARAVLAYDPEAAQRRRERARKDASVQSWTEGSGNAGLAGRELAPADVIEASARLTEHARWLRQQGVTGNTDELRAAAYVALLTGRSLDTLVPADSRPPSSAEPEGGRVGEGLRRDCPAADGESGRTECAGSGGSAGGESAGSGSAGCGCGGGGDVGCGDGNGTGAGWAGRGCAGGVPTGSGPAPAGGRLGGTINLTMSLSAWLGLGDAPGEVAGHGPVDAGACRDLAARTGPGTRWCLTLTGADGRAVAHACASGPPPAGAKAIAWAAGVRERLQFLETGTCSHARRSSRYRPPPNLVHLIRVRQRTCSFPGCRRPARRTDLDHTVPWQHGGDTCECNLAPLCRRHHQAKQSPGWQLTQPRPGEMFWRLPSGRIYATSAEPYPV